MGYLFPSAGSSSSFTDNFNRVGLGDDWIVTVWNQTPFTPPIGIGFWLITANQLSLDSIVVNNPGFSLRTGCFAVRTRVGTLSKNQYVQVTFVSKSGPMARSGPALLINDATESMYFLEVDTVALTAYLLRINAGAVTNVGSSFPVAPGDVLRISADLSDISKVTLIIKKNGVVADTVLDSSAGQIRSGYTGGLYARVVAMSGGTVSNSTWDNFSCGVS